MTIEIKQTSRGFDAGKFTDLYASECSIQKSSLATQDCIWLGVDQPAPDMAGLQLRMHLTRATVADLLPLLQRFVDTGELE